MLLQRVTQLPGWQVLTNDDRWRHYGKYSQLTDYSSERSSGVAILSWPSARGEKEIDGFVSRSPAGGSARGGGQQQLVAKSTEEVYTF